MDDKIKIENLIDSKISEYLKFLEQLFGSLKIDKDKIVKDIFEEEKEVIDSLLQDEKESLFLRVAGKIRREDIISNKIILYYLYLIKKHKNEENPSIFALIKEKLESSLLNDRKFLEYYAYYFRNVEGDSDDVDEQVLKDVKKELEKEFIDKYRQKISRLENELKIKKEVTETLKIWLTKAEIPNKHLKKLMETYEKEGIRYFLAFKIEKGGTDKLKNMLNELSVLKGQVTISKVKTDRGGTRNINLGVHLIRNNDYIFINEKIENEKFPDDYYGLLALVPISIDGFKDIIVPEYNKLGEFTKIARDELWQLFRGVAGENIIYLLSEEIIFQAFPLNILCGDISPPLTESERIYFVENNSKIRKILNINRVYDLHKYDVDTILKTLKKNIGLPNYKSNEFLLAFDKEFNEIKEKDIEDRIKEILKLMVNRSKKLCDMLQG